MAFSNEYTEKAFLLSVELLQQYYAACDAEGDVVPDIEKAIEEFFQPEMLWVINEDKKTNGYHEFLDDRNGEIQRVLKIVRMEDNAQLKFKKCSLGMKQRVGIAMALLGDPALLILDEPINGLDTDGMRIMREILVDITKN